MMTTKRARVVKVLTKEEGPMIPIDGEVDLEEPTRSCVIFSGGKSYGTFIMRVNTATQ